MEDKKGQKKGLGQGLSALLGSYPDTSVVSPNSPSRIQETEQTLINVDLIDANPWQPRTHFEETALQELAASIKIHGLIQPITLRKTENGRYQLIAGERRLRASKMAELTEVPAYVRTASDMQMLEMGLIENIQRHDLNPIEIALSYQRLIDECNINQVKLAEVVSKDRSVITSHLTLLKLCPEVQEAISKGKISMGHAKTFPSDGSREEQVAFLKVITENQLTVRQTEDLKRELKNPEKKNPEKKTQETKISLPTHVEIFRSSLKTKLNAKVDIKRDVKGKGSIVIGFSSDEELEKIMQFVINDK